ncbi:MAG: FAD:protein FMN transferase [Spirochaetes bacterium]|nr:FAD:protein FMN transferase [Spirochaetota bacterium]
MFRISYIRVLLSALGTIVAFSCVQSPRDRVTRARFLMDTYCSITIPAAEHAQESLDAAFARMEAVERSFNVHTNTSPLYAFNKSGVPVTDSEIVTAMESVLDVCRDSGGAFDCTVFPIVDAWGFYGPHENTVPSAAHLAALRPLVNWRFIAVNRGRLVKLLPAVRVDLGGAAKGYAAHEAAKTLASSGVRSAIVDAGGNIYALGDNNGKPWRIGVQNPRDGSRIVGIIVASNTSVSTSGDYQRYFETNGVRYHHIIDPATGCPAQSGIASVTIMHPDGLYGDLLSTAVFVLGAERGGALIERMTNAGAVIVLTNGNVIVSSRMKPHYIPEKAR